MKSLSQFINENFNNRLEYLADEFVTEIDDRIDELTKGDDNEIKEVVENTVKDFIEFIYDKMHEEDKTIFKNVLNKIAKTLK